MPLDDIHATGGAEFRERSNRQSNEDHQGGHGVVVANDQGYDTMPHEPTTSAPSGQTMRVSLCAEFPDDPTSLIDSCFDAQGFPSHALLDPIDVNDALDVIAGLMPLDDIHATGGAEFRERSNRQSNEDHQGGHGVVVANDQGYDTMPHEPTTSAPSGQTVRVWKARQNEYKSRESKINSELHRLQEEGIVKLRYSDGDQHGIGGGRLICGIQSSVFATVIDRLNACISSWSKKAGTPSENLTQCLRDCGVVPRQLPGRTNYNWRQPADGVWEFSAAAMQKRLKRLQF